MSFLAAIALVAGTADPRIALVDLQRAGEDRKALVELDRLRAEAPESARALGLALLRGHLLTRTGRPSEAAAAFAESIGDAPDLAPWARLRLAETQAALGHPEVAAGVAATLLAHQPPEPLVEPAFELFVAALRQGGDCRLLGGLAGRIWPREVARRLELARAECEIRRRDEVAARRRLELLLTAESDDLAAFDAAEIWLDRFDLPADRDTLRALGEALSGQRDFERALPVLEAALAGVPRSGEARESDTIYRLARAEFWLGRHGRAARAFEELYRTTRSVSLRADARYQQARCLELAGDRTGAATLYLETVQIEPRGEWAGPALLGRLRLDWIAGRKIEASATLDRLATDRGWRSALARGAVFLAASEIVAGRAGSQVASWLDAAERSEAASREEVAYWRGRAAELEARPDEAVRRYLEAQVERPFHPFAVAARGRLTGAALRERAESVGTQQARGGTLAEMQRSWILLGPVRPLALASRARALTALSALPETAPWIRWSPTPAGDWPIFRAVLNRPEERLLALGLLREGSPALSRHFPAGRPALAFTAAHLLDVQDHAGLSIDLAERLFSARPKELRPDWVTPELRRLLFPLPYRATLLAQTGLRRVDPWLLAAILREESRFRPEAVSPVGARGVAQLTLPTARRLSRLLGLPSGPGVADLHRPEVAIPLAAAYLAELTGRFDGLDPAILAAYNAGEAQTELWRSYCSTREPEELLAKIGFRETRAYVFRVLESRAQYAALYGL
jgi:soluble lytic murein transglycosylase